MTSNTQGDTPTDNSGKITVPRFMSDNHLFFAIRNSPRGQYKIAAQAGITKSYLSKLLSGNKQLTPTLRERLQNAAMCTVTTATKENV